MLARRDHDGNVEPMSEGKEKRPSPSCGMELSPLVCSDWSEGFVRSMMSPSRVLAAE